MKGSAAKTSGGAQVGTWPYFALRPGARRIMKRSLFFVVIACLAAGFSSVCFAQDAATDDKLTREEWQSCVNPTRERLKQRREELQLEREKQVGPMREELRQDREEQFGPKQEELRLDRENRLGQKQEELRLDREKRIEPKRDELRRERDEEREQQKGIVPPSPAPAR